jgi:hypothetical protein
MKPLIVVNTNNQKEKHTVRFHSQLGVMMKTRHAVVGFIGIGLIGVAISALPPTPPTPQQLVLSWNADTNADGYELRSSSDVNIPYTNWPVLGSVSGVNNTNFQFSMTPSKQFFVCIASNFWGYGQPSNTTNTPNVTSPVTGLNPHK